MVSVEDAMENPYKMSYHIEPPQGLLNDPNGLVQFNGTYYFDNFLGLIPQ